MAPIYVKGGIWTNIEDEILKAAVSKYGLNQWDRVASLLTKKSAKQAKARWNEWLNPNIDKSEWTREQDEKLLSLAKLLPNQWRSIAPLVGRTATHCVERYQKLIEDAASFDSEVAQLKLSGPGIELLPSNSVGDLNINPESKASKPDLEEMDDEDREMLSEAKARLANTQGKKAKRKARDRMLEESKRIALLQKRRELKDAGIKVSLQSRNQKKRQHFDFNADIPHELQPAQGLYDTTEENEVNYGEKEKFDRQVSAQGMNIPETAKKPSKDTKKRLNQDLQAAAELLQETQRLKKPKLELPLLDLVADEDIDQRIHHKTKEVLLRKTIPVEKAPEPQPKKTTKTSLAAVIALKFALLPPPVNRVKVVVPNFDENEDAVVEAEPALVDQGERLRNLELLRSVEAEKAKLRRSLAVQKGLGVPHPNTVHFVQGKMSEVERRVMEEVVKLVRSDYFKYEDPSFQAEILDDLDEETQEMVEREISEQKETSGTKEKGVEEPAIEVPDDLKTFEAAEKAIHLLHELYQRHEQESEGFEKEVEEVYLLISKHREDIESAAIESEVYTAVSVAETNEMERRKATLHEMVDLLVQSEQKLQEKRRERLETK